MDLPSVKPSSTKKRKCIQCNDKSQRLFASTSLLISNFSCSDANTSINKIELRLPSNNNLSNVINTNNQPSHISLEQRKLNSKASYKRLPLFSFMPLLTVLTGLALIFDAHFMHMATAASTAGSSRSSITDKRHYDSDNDGKSGVYDNQITSEPEIECGYGVVHFRVFTSKGHASAVFVRGQSSNPDCVFHNTRNVTIELAKCNIRRKREVNPSGVAYQMTVVVQMHPLFVTKVDRAYNVNCFYMERRQDVNVEFGVSDITTQMVQMDAVLPTCTYSVHRDSPNGPLVKYTKVGEQLYHVWDCPSKMYSMLLYSCVAISGAGNEYAIIDEHGCSKDEFLMPQISYTADNTKAMVASAAFNIPDQNTMSFACKIRLCYNNECSAITPPKCSNVNRTVSPTDVGENVSEELDNDQLYSSTAPTTIAKSSNNFRVTENKSSLTISTASAEFFSAASSAETTTVENTIETSTVTIESSKAAKQTSSTASRGGGPSSTELVPEEDEQEDEHSTQIPSDFPRPSAFLVQQDDPIGRGSGEAFEEDDVASNLNQTPYFIKKAAKLNNKPVVDANNDSAEDNFYGSTPPVKILQRPSASKAASANAKNSAAMNRQQRDTTQSSTGKMPERRSALHQSTQFVDLDISSPELTILDDNNLELSTAERLSASSSAGSDFNNFGMKYYQRDPALFDLHSYHQTNVCFSPIALALAGGLLMLLIIAIAFVLLKSRKTSHTFN